jgi:hypothetical protein
MQLCLLLPAVAGLATLAIAPSGAAQDAPEAARHFAPFVSGGASLASRLPDAGGMHVELGVIRPLSHGFSLPTCEAAGPCDNSTYELEMRSTQPGMNGGVGAQMPLGKVSLFTDIRVHYMFRTSPSGGPSNDYLLMPLTVGLRL